MGRLLRIGWATLLLAAAPVARPNDALHDRLDAAYQRDDAEAARIARDALAHPQTLSATQTLEAHSYLCNALDDQDQFDAALAESRAVADALPAKPAADRLEYTAELITCVGFAAKQKQQFAQAMADFDRAISMIGSAEPIHSTHDVNLIIALSDALYRRAGLYDTLGDHADALSDLTRALKVLPDDPADPNLAAQRMNIASESGRILLHRQEYAQAARVYEDLLGYAQRMQDTHAEAIVRLHLGECYRGLQRWQESGQAYQRALAIATASKDLAVQGRAHAGLGALERARKDDPAALSDLVLAHTELAAAKLPLEQVSADLDRAEALADLRQWPQLTALADQIVASLTAIGDKRLLAQAYELRARAAEAVGNLPASLDDMRRVVSLKDEIRDSELKDELAKRNAQFEVAQLEDKAKLLSRENELSRLQIRHDRDINIAQRAAIAVAILIVLLLAYVIHRRVKTQRLLTRLAQEDPLTGLNNRRAALAAAQDLFAAAQRTGGTLGLAILDIDHFKSINDGFGHTTGDSVLIATARCMREALRTDDVCGRVGGEEFLFVFPHCDRGHAIALLDRIRTAVGALRVDGLPASRRVTLSAGLTERKAEDATLDVMVRRADVSLYAAKNAGRDRVVADPA